MKIIIFMQERLFFFSEGKIQGLHYHTTKNKALPRSVEDISTRNHIILFFFPYFCRSSGSTQMVTFIKEINKKFN